MKLIKGICITAVIACFWAVLVILIVAKGNEVILPLAATLAIGAISAYFAVKLEKKGV